MATGDPMVTAQELIYEWEEEAGFPRPPTPMAPGEEVAEFRLRLIEEEFNELKDAVENQDTIEIADALGDLVWVTYAMARSCGIDLDDVIREIARSNFTKLVGGVERENEKVMKGDQYEPPQITRVLFGTDEGIGDA